MGALILFILVVFGIGIGLWYVIMRGIFRAGAKAIGKAQERAMERTLDKKAETDGVGVLNQRLARGEVTQDEYRSLRSALEQASADFRR